MLLDTTYKDYKEIPGGYVETGESPLQACVREVKEELGISPEIGHLLVVDWAPGTKEGDKVLYIFDGGTLSSDAEERIVLQAEELRDYAYYPVDRIENLTIPRLARRIRAAVKAREQRSFLYLEHGQEVTRQLG